MANLKCVRHNRRVMVIDIGTADNSIPLTIHRDGGKRNDICESETVTIDRERFTPQMVIDDDWSDSEILDDQSDSELPNNSVLESV